MKEKIIKSKYLFPVSYILFFCFCFVLFVYSTLPLESIKEKIVYEVARNSQFSIEVKGLNVSPFFRLELLGCKLYRDRRPILEIKELIVSPSMFSLFRTNLSITYDANLLDGKAVGKISYNTDLKVVERVEGKIDNISVENATSVFTDDFIKEKFLSGTVDGDFDVILYPKSQGRIAFDIENLEVGNIRVRQIPLPNFRNMNANFVGRINNDITSVDGFNIKGEDFELKIAGTMPVFWKIKRGGKIDLQLSLLSKTSKLSFVKSFLKPQSDGSVGGKISGTIGNIKFVKNIR